MKRLFTILLLVFSVTSMMAGNNLLSLDSIIAGAYKPEKLPDFCPMQDPSLYSSLDETGTKLNSYVYQTGKLKETMLDLTKARGSKLKKIAGYSFNGQETKILIWEEERPIYRHSFLTEYYVYDRKRNLIEPLSEKGNQRDAKFSPDGRSIAFVRDNNLFIKRLDFGSELTVTTDGAMNRIINGAADWMYEEEAVMTAAYAWSPDSECLAYLKFNERSVPEYTFTLYGNDRMGGEAPVYYPGFRTYRYASAGDTISTVTVHVYQLKIRSSRKLSVPVDADGYIPRIRFTRRNNQLAVMTLNRNQNEFKLFFVNPKSGVAKLILTDQSDTYVCPDFDEIQFSTNYFTYLSEKDGYRHLYLYNANGGLRKKLTAGKWDVTKFLGCDTIKGLFYYQAAVESPMKRSVWQVDLNGKTRRISTVDGVCDGVFNRNYTLFVQTASTIKTPKITTLCNVSGQALRTISDNKALKTRLSEISYADKTFFTVPATDGQILNGWMLKPANFDASKKYPVIQLQYSGPDAQEVLDRFNFDWEYYLAEKGFVVVSVDGRGTGGRGADFRRLTYGKLGQLESQDQIAVANYLKKQAYIDGSRMGIWGWSFGGFITLMSMTNPDSPFKAGVAVAPVTDYRYYDAMYTERYMKTPAENKEGYDAGSPLLRASQLKGRLLLVHGLADDNVRANQSLDFDEALIRAGIRFDSQFYPISNHSILGETYRRHLYNTKVEFFLKNL